MMLTSVVSLESVRPMFKMWLWLGLVLLRVGWAISPQTGYIHPDEFFQTVEVVAGDALDIRVERTWEFNATEPIRSILIPQLLFAPAFRLLRLMSDNIPGFQLTGRKVLCSTRLVMALLSLCVDLCLSCICAELKLDRQRALLLLGSSYVMLTYITHSFSNSIEAVLLSAVIVLIIKSADCSAFSYNKQHVAVQASDDRHNIKASKHDLNGSDSETDVLSDSYGMLSKLHSSAFDLKKRKRKQSEELSDKAHTETQLAGNSTGHPRASKVSVDDKSFENRQLFTCALLAILNTAGIFNRPTFALFSIVPFLWWLSNFWRNFSMLVSRTAVFIIISVFSGALFIIADTLYYNEMTLKDIGNLEKWLSYLICTPWNFFVYNSNASNLAEHGRHPFYLHFLVNLCLLFGPLMLFVYKGILRICCNLIDYVMKSKSKLSAKNDPLTTRNADVILLFILSPVIFLSIFPHQEPRFLVPLLLLVTLYAVLSSMVLTKWFYTTVLLFNIILSVLYGVVHQGGLVPCLIRLEELTRGKHNVLSANVIFSHTYMPPKHPLLLGQQSNIQVHDFKGSTLQNIHNKISELNISGPGETPSASNKIFIVMPGTVAEEFREENVGKIKLRTVEKFFPHLSLEDPPLIDANSSWMKIRNRLSLFLMEVESW